MVVRLSLERDKPELAQIKDTLEKNKENMKNDLSSVDEMLKQVQGLKLEKRDLKSKVVRPSPSSLPPSFLLPLPPLTNEPLHTIGRADDRNLRHPSLKCERQRPHYAVPRSRQA